MGRYYWPLTPAQHRTVTRNVDKRLSKRFKAGYDAFLDQPMLLDQPQGRELLAFYRTRGAAWWQMLLAAYPERARYHARTWMALKRKYEREDAKALLP